MNTVGAIVVRHLVAYLSMQKLLVWDIPIYVKVSPKLAHPFKNVDFQSIFVRSTSAVTGSEKSSINAIDSPLQAFQLA